MGRFFGKVAVFTDGGSGIGAATAKAFAWEGAKVVVADLNEQSGVLFLASNEASFITGQTLAVDGEYTVA